jgi:acyl-coenzyme A thioesterase PaaI-like protein
VARISFLTDEHIPSAVAKGRGVEAFTLAEKAQLGSSDRSLLAFAAAEGRVLITADPDHLRLHAAGVSHAGIVFTPSDASVGAIIGGAMLIAEVLTSEEMLNHVEFV